MEKRKPKGPSPDELLDVIDLRDFAQRAVTRTFPKNTGVVREGDRTDSLYIIVAGKVKIYVSDEGKEIVLNESGPGEYFGEMVLDEGPRSASVMTLEPTQFLVVPKEDFREFVKKNPEFSLHLIYKRSEEHTSNSSHSQISYAVFCLKKKKTHIVVRRLAPTSQTTQPALHVA